jgi:hypothetical protein
MLSHPSLPKVGDAIIVTSIFGGTFSIGFSEHRLLLKLGALSSCPLQLSLLSIEIA